MSNKAARQTASNPFSCLELLIGALGKDMSNCELQQANNVLPTSNFPPPEIWNISVEYIIAALEDYV